MKEKLRRGVVLLSEFPRWKKIMNATSIYLFCYFVRLHLLSSCCLFLLPFLIYSVSEEAVISYYGESNSVGGGSDNMGGSSRRLDRLRSRSLRPNEEGEEVSQPQPENPPSNQVAPRGDEAGPSNQPPIPYQYHPDEVIGGDSILSIERRLLSNKTSPSAQDIYMARINAEDLFEVKVEIIKLMAGLDPTGDWMGRGARSLDNPSHGGRVVGKAPCLFRRSQSGRKRIRDLCEMKREGFP